MSDVEYRPLHCTEEEIDRGPIEERLFVKAFQQTNDGELKDLFQPTDTSYHIGDCIKKGSVTMLSASASLEENDASASLEENDASASLEENDAYLKYRGIAKSKNVVQAVIRSKDWYELSDNQYRLNSYQIIRVI